MQSPHRGPPPCFVPDPPRRHPLTQGALAPAQDLRPEAEQQEVAASTLYHRGTHPRCGGDGGHGLAGIAPGGGIDPARCAHRRTHRKEAPQGEFVAGAAHTGVVSPVHGFDVGQPPRPPGPAGNTGVGPQFRVQAHTAGQPARRRPVGDRLGAALKAVCPGVPPQCRRSPALMTGSRACREPWWCARDTPPSRLVSDTADARVIRCCTGVRVRGTLRTAVQAEPFRVNAPSQRAVYSLDLAVATPSLAGEGFWRSRCYPVRMCSCRRGDGRVHHALCGTTSSSDSGSSGRPARSASSTTRHLRTPRSAATRLITSIR